MGIDGVSHIQSNLFARVGGLLPAHLSLADELASLLGVSRDSAYRRLRGDTELSLAETALICKRFGLSMDGLIGPQAGAVQFQQDGAPDMDMEGRLAVVNAFLKQMEQAASKEIVYFSMELPFFHILQVPELLAFKRSYWHSVLHPDEPLPQVQLTGAGSPELALEIVGRYIRIPSTEIIYESALSTTLQQVHYFLESGCFADPQDALRVCDALRALVAHLKVQAVLGRKFRYGAPAPEQGPANNYRLFLNEMVYSQNIIHTRMDGREAVFLEHNVVQFMQTTDEGFCKETATTLATIQGKSIPISAVSERERNKFFNRLEASIDRMRTRAEMLIAGS